MNNADELKLLVAGSHWRAVELLLRENLAELIGPAIEIAYGNSMVATILARVIEDTTDIGLLADAYNDFHNGSASNSGRPKYPAGNVAFGEVAIAIGRKVLKIALEQPDLTRLRADGVPLFTNLAGWHAIVGQHVEAARVAREAVTFFDHGAASDNPAEVANFAGALERLLATLRPLGLEQEADEAGRRAIERYRRLADIDAAAHGPRLARALVNWAGGLRGDGSIDVRVSSYREAAALYREALAAGQVDLNPELCQTLIGFASVLVDAARLDEALEVAVEGREIAARLNARNVPSYGQLGVMALTNLALVRQRRGEANEAVLMFETATGMARHLHGLSHKAFHGLLARCLATYGRALVDVSDLEGAFETLDEFARICSAANGINDHAFLSGTYINFAILASETGRLDRVMEGVARARSELDLLPSADPGWIADSRETLRQLEALAEKQ